MTDRLTDERWLLLDVGNTCIKAAVLVNGELIGFGFTNEYTIAAIDRLVQGFVGIEIPGRAAMATVNARSVGDAIAHALDRRQIRLAHVLASDGELLATGFLKHDLETPETTGIDRLLGVAGALNRSPEKCVVVVDCGSAITVNVGTADWVFRGGAILPGLQLSARALQSGTAALPLVEIHGPPVAPGRSTLEAIRVGLFYGLCGAISRLVDETTRRVQSDCFNPIDIYVTGGDAALLSPMLPMRHLVTPNLVLEGLAQFVLTRSRGESTD